MRIRASGGRWRQRWPAGLALAGALGLAAGLAYDLAFAGLPFHDAPDLLALRHAWHARNAATLQLGGAALLAAGLGSTVLRALLRRTLRVRSAAGTRNA